MKKRNQKELAKILEALGNMFLNIKLLRQERGWTIEELSEVSGIDVKILTDIEDGQDFDTQYLKILCRVYRIRPRKIFKRIF